MTQTPQFGILAIDGGGTRCRLALKQNDMVIKVETGAANASTNFDQAVTQICLGLDHLASKAGQSITALSETPAYLGIAGVVSPEISARLKSALPLSRLRIDDDRPAALRGAVGEADGAIAHCGTGSFLACQIQGQARIIGGWGAVLGDEASAQWLGRQALSRTLDVADDLAVPSPLSRAILKQLHTPAGIVAFAASASPAQMGEFAQEVTHQAKAGDVHATQLMHQGAQYIARNLSRIGWLAGSRLCLTGGLGPQYGPYLPSTIQSDLCAPLSDPLTGALALAQDFASEGRQ